MKNKTARNSKLNGPYDKHIFYTGEVVDMSGYDFGEMSIENYLNRESDLRGVLEDLLSMSYGNIGDIVIREDMTSPEGVQQSDILKFSIVGGNQAPYDANILFFGEVLKIKKGETITTIRQNMYDIINNYKENNMFFSDVKINDVNNLEITYKDTRKHNSEEMIPFPHFISMEIETITENRHGHGKWELIGTKSETLDSGNITMNYFKRIG